MRSIVLGEASESDNDDEIYSYDKNKLEQSNLSVISGEAPESDDDQAPTIFQIPQSDNNIDDDKKYNTLLHKKLYESNQKLRKSITDLYKTTTTNVLKRLNTSDNNLLQSQIILQSASTNLYTASENLKHIQIRLHDVLDSNFIPDICIPKE
uniref:Biogenesis of lysosome-related organelles complex 1 subunit 3 n=1 Tax=Xenopsylla cheopis TaxID=163159 RepID=A0A6M2DQQ4_XENCH